MEPNVLQELLVLPIKPKLLVQLELMEFHAFSIYQLDKLQEQNHADPRNVQISRVQLMMHALGKFQTKHVFLMELIVLNKTHVPIIRINYHAKEEVQMVNAHLLQHQL